MAQTPAGLWAGRAGRVDFGVSLLGPSRAPVRAGARGAGRVPAPCAGRRRPGPGAAKTANEPVYG